MASKYFTGYVDPSEVEDESPLRRYGKQFVRGATFGFAGSKERPEGIGEHVAEFAGGVLPTAAISAVASPLAGVGLRAAGVGARALPLTSRLATAAAVGATSQGLSDVAETGETTAGRVALGAGLGTAQEGLFLGGAKLVKALRQPKVGKAPIIEPPIEQTTKADVVNEVTGDLPVARSQLALPAVGETSPTTGSEFAVSPMPTRMSGRVATGKTVPLVRDLEERTQGVRKFTVADELERTNAVLNEHNIAQTKEKFHIGTDPETGLTEFISKDKVTDEAIALATAKPLGKGPVSPESIGRDSKLKVDVTATQEPSLTTNLLKQSDEVVNGTVMTDKPPAIAKYMKMGYTPEAIEALGIAQKLGVDEKFLQTLADAGQAIRNPAQRNALILNKLKEICG